MVQQPGDAVPTSVTGPQEPSAWVFDAFRVDPREVRLWCGDAVLPLHAKAFAVLCCLVTQAGQLVTKDALLEAVWPETAVSEAVLQVAIREVRQALGDSARMPHFIETVHGRGYRFLAPVRAVASAGRGVDTGPLHRVPAVLVRRPPHFVGRNAELTCLAQWWTTAQQGTRQVGIIAGEPGIGKTALVETFIAQVAARNDLWVGHGQCVDQYGAGEAYLPVLEALGRLGHGPAGGALLPVLRQYAPNWLVHLPALLTAAEREALARTTSEYTPARMLRELADALEVFTAAHPLVLVLEDLHWSDDATLAWLAYLARRPDPARLLVLGTYRPVEVIVAAHPLRRMLTELRQHGHCTELVLDYLSEAAVTAYLAQYFGGMPLPAGLAPVLHRHTRGNPLFLRAVVEELLAQHLLEEADGRWHVQGTWETLTGIVPENLRRLIEQQLERCAPDEQALLEAASVAGRTFTTAAITAGVGQPEDRVDRQCALWARQGRFVHAGETETWPDGTVTARYSFVHALYHEVVYRRVAAGQRVHLHRRIGERAESAYGAQAGAIAAELAMHFERGRDYPRAVAYLQHAADTAVRRYANAEAANHLSKGLALLTGLPATVERTQQEFALQCALGASLMAVKGFAAPEVERAYARARDLCPQAEDTPQHCFVLWGLLQFYMVRAAFPTALELGKRLIGLAQRLHDVDILLAAHNGLGTVLPYRGELRTARTHLEQSLALYDPQHHHARIFFYGTNLKADSLAHLAQVLWLLGYPETALQRGHEALALAHTHEPLHCFTLAHVANYLAVVHHLRREERLAQERAEVGRRLSREHGFAAEWGRGTILHGWACVLQGQGEGLGQMRQGLAAYQATGAEVWKPYYLALLAEAYGRGRQRAKGLRRLTEALTVTANNGETWWAAELHRLRGDLLLGHAGARRPVVEAEQCFQQALAIARHQQAKSLELRAAISLSRLWQQQGRETAAYELLAPIYGWFTEGFDTADLQDAKALLEALEK
ncbi:MAG TPA: AAA family ATPase [Candidatus Tectomicrobia bacterium]|jgi:predicted ATPase/DNA-binding winged helix-turn-helix (wHTH) protein